MFALAEGRRRRRRRDARGRARRFRAIARRTARSSTIPLPADEDAGTFTLTVDRPNGRIVRQITVADRDFGRELIFLTDSLVQARDEHAGDRARRARRPRHTHRSSQRSSGGAVGGASRSLECGARATASSATTIARRIRRDRSRSTRRRSRAARSPATRAMLPFSGRHRGGTRASTFPRRRGAPCVAPASGIVVDVGDYVLSGRTVLVDHGQGAVSAYFHLDTAARFEGRHRARRRAHRSRGINRPRDGAAPALRALSPRKGRGSGRVARHASMARRRGRLRVQSVTHWLLVA